MRFARYKQLLKRANEIETQKDIKEIGKNKIDTKTFSIGNSYIEIWENSPYANGANSVYSFIVDEDLRGQGIGSKLLDAVNDYYNGKPLSAQVSSIASLKVFFNKGFKTNQNPNATWEELVKLFNESYQSLNMRIN